MLYNIDNQYYFCLSSALFLPDAVARVEAFALGRQEKEVISEADVSSPENFFVGKVIVVGGVLSGKVRNADCWAVRTERGRVLSVL